MLGPPTGCGDLIEGSDTSDDEGEEEGERQEDDQDRIAKEGEQQRDYSSRPIRTFMGHELKKWSRLRDVAEQEYKGMDVSDE